MRILKVGDAVRVSRDSTHPAAGEKGKIVGVDKTFFHVLLDNPRLASVENKWWEFFPEELELIQVFRVGDRVRVLPSCPRKDLIGKTGVVHWVQEDIGTMVFVHLDGEKVSRGFPRERLEICDVAAQPPAKEEDKNPFGLLVGSEASYDYLCPVEDRPIWKGPSAGRQN